MLRLLPNRSGRSLLTAVVFALLVAGLGACGDDGDGDADDDSDATTTEAPADGGGEGGDGGDGGDEAESATIVAQDFEFADVTVAPGGEIVLDNQDDAPHTATADDGAFDTGEVAGGETSEPVTAPAEPGSYAFHCEIHTDMTATLTVEA